MMFLSLKYFSLLRRLRLVLNLSSAQTPLPLNDTEHCQNLESNDLKFQKRFIIVQVPFVEIFQLEKIFTVLFLLLFLNISPGELARTAFLITFVGQTVERDRLAQA